jgi:hypothetical protein
MLALVLVIAAMFALAPPAGAVGPGGWDHLGHGSSAALPSLNGAVLALNSDDPGVLLVAGSFTSAGGNTKAARIAVWNGTSWGAIGSTPLSNGSVRAIAYHAGKVYVGGTFLNAGGNSDVDYLAVWDGSTWSSPCISTTPGPAITATVNALQIVGNTLYVGGSFGNGAGIASADFLVGCDLTTGAASSTVLHDGDINSGVSALTTDGSGTLYAGGSFINLAGISDADHVASYDGSWHPLPSGFGAPAVDSIVRSLSHAGGDIYVGTDAVNIAGILTADHVVRWDGSKWFAVGSNTANTDGWFPSSAFIYSLTTLGSIVFAAGSFQNANGIAAADQIAYFDGSTWRPLGSNGAGNGPLNSQSTSVGVFQQSVFAGGNFTAAGGDTHAQAIAAFAVFQPDARIGLVAAGPFLGSNVYSATAVGETRSVAVKRGHNVVFYINMQNDGIFSSSYKVKGTGGARGIIAHFYQGSTNITPQVLAGTYSSGDIAPRANKSIRMIVTVSKNSVIHGSYVVRLTASSVTPQDAVRALITAH